jgi:uncharacterized protein
VKSEKDIIDTVTAFVRDAVSRHDSGHGWSHIGRVVRLALHICECEGRGDRFVVELGALMHDVGDHKFGTHNGPAEIRRILEYSGVDSSVIHEVISINENISFSKGLHTIEKSIGLQIVQDADRLDAMGAIGIARAFNYGGFKGNEIFDPRIELAINTGAVSASSNSVSTIHHFYDKLLLLKDLMNTPTGRQMARERHDFMVTYLDQFFREWNAEK